MKTPNSIRAQLYPTSVWSCALYGFLQNARWIRRIMHKAFLPDPSQGELPFPLRCFAAIPLIPVFANAQAGQTLTGFANLQAVHCHPSFQSGNTAPAIPVLCKQCPDPVLPGFSAPPCWENSQTLKIARCAATHFFQNAKRPSGSFFCFCRMVFPLFY